MCVCLGKVARCWNLQATLRIPCKRWEDVRALPHNPHSLPSLNSPLAPRDAQSYHGVSAVEHKFSHNINCHSTQESFALNLISYLPHALLLFLHSPFLFCYLSIPRAYSLKNSNLGHCGPQGQIFKAQLKSATTVKTETVLTFGSLRRPWQGNGFVLGASEDKGLIHTARWAEMRTEKISRLDSRKAGITAFPRLFWDYKRKLSMSYSPCRRLLIVL